MGYAQFLRSKFMYRFELNDNTEESFWKIWEENKQFLFNVCLFYTKRRFHDAQDLLSESMVKAMSTVKKQDLHNPLAYLTQLIKNTFIDQYRRCQQKDFNLIYTEDYDTHEKPIHFGKQSPLDELLDRELHNHIQQSFSKIPPRRYNLTKLYFLGYSYADIADSFCVSQDTIRRMVHVSRSELKESIQNYHSGKVAQPQTNDTTIYSHLVKYSNTGKAHYHNIVNTLPPIRLKQKELSIKNYLQANPYAVKRRYKLAVTLGSQGKFSEALRNLSELIVNDYHTEEVYDLLIRFSLLVSKRKQALHNTALAMKTLASPPPKFYAKQMLIKGQIYEAENYLKSTTLSDPSNIESRLLLAQVYEFSGKKFEAFKEYEAIHSECQSRPEMYSSHLHNKLIFDNRDQAEKLAEGHMECQPDSGLAIIYHLHFLISAGYDLSDQYIMGLLTRLKKLYNWHPDVALLKALMNPDKLSKILLRRCKDHTKCILSQHYLATFSDYKINVGNLSQQEKTHLSIVKMIHNKRLLYES